MRYRLVLLTHGGDAHASTLRRTLDSFFDHVRPWPTDYVCVRDGNGPLPPINPDGQTWRGLVLQPQQGFCAATRAAWRAATLPGEDYVFWLEHDFAFLRPVDLSDAAGLLDADPTLAQVSLLRGPENPAERRAGGVVEAQVRAGKQVLVRRDFGADFNWLDHEAYFTTNPSLMRREFMADNPWPDDGEQCEGKYGLALRERGYHFGILGDGEPWIEHTGRRDGFGY